MAGLRSRSRWWDQGPLIRLQGNNDKSSTYCLPKRIQDFTCSSTPLDFLARMSSYYYAHFKNEKTEDRRDWRTFSGYTNLGEVEPGRGRTRIQNRSGQDWLFPFHCGGRQHRDKTISVVPAFPFSFSPTCHLLRLKRDLASLDLVREWRQKLTLVNLMPGWLLGCQKCSETNCSASRHLLIPGAGPIFGSQL